MDFREKLNRELERTLNGAGLNLEGFDIGRSQRGGFLITVRARRGAVNKTGHFVAKDESGAQARAVASAAANYFTVCFKQSA